MVLRIVKAFAVQQSKPLLSYTAIAMHYMFVIIIPADPTLLILKYDLQLRGKSLKKCTFFGISQVLH